MKPNFIKEIKVKKLFGHYNYNIKIPSIKNKEISSMSLLYGDNGTGKTTILNLIFHLLSTAHNRGHRTFIAKVPLNRFSIKFMNNTKISIIRKNSTLTGSYIIELSEDKTAPISAKVKVEEVENRVISESLTNKFYELYEKVERLKLSIFFLGDDRDLQSDKYIFRVEEDRYERLLSPGHRRRLIPPSEDLRDISLRQSLERTENWIRTQLIQQASQGEADAQNIYVNIVENINKIGIKLPKDLKEEREPLIQAMKELEKRIRLFTEFGLILRINFRQLIKHVTNTKRALFPYVAPVVRSFIDSQKARLDALEKFNNLLNQFVKLINGFFFDKKIRLQVREGISIFSDSGERIKPEFLSSGEKQLLLLLFNVLTSRDVASLFIIDEPELSLNIKWQRRLIDALFTITYGSHCQFLLATHSIELLTKHRSKTIKLDPKEKFDNYE